VPVRVGEHPHRVLFEQPAQLRLAGRCAHTPYCPANGRTSHGRAPRHRRCRTAARNLSELRGEWFGVGETSELGALRGLRDAARALLSLEGDASADDATIAPARADALA